MPVVSNNQGNTPVPVILHLLSYNRGHVQLGHCLLSRAYGTGSTDSGTTGDTMTTLWVDCKVIDISHQLMELTEALFMFHQPLFSNSTTLLTLLRPGKEGTSCFPYVT